VKALLERATTDPSCLVVPGHDNGPRKSHTIFRNRTPDAPVLAAAPSVALPEGVEMDAGNSLYSVLMSTSSQHGSMVARASGVTEYRQLAEYPPVTEEVRAKFQGTLKQYRKWEADQLLKMREAMKGPEDKKAKEKKDGAKDKKDDKKKGKKGKKASTVVEVEEKPPEDVPPEPAFIQNFNISPFDHSVQVLRLRAQQRDLPSGEELLRHATEVLHARDEAVKEVTDTPLPGESSPPGCQVEGGAEALSCAVRVENIDYEILAANPTLLKAVQQAVRATIAQEAGVGPEHVSLAFKSGSLIVNADVELPAGVDANTLRQRLDVTALSAAVATAVAAVDGIDEAATGEIHAAAPDATLLLTPPDCQASDPEPLAATQDLGEALATSQSAETRTARQKLMQESPFEFQFSYFKSEMGLQFLMDTGQLDLERRPVQKKKKDPQDPKHLPKPPRNPWNPRLVGEPGHEEEEARMLAEAQDMDEGPHAALHQEQNQGLFPRFGPAGPREDSHDITGAGYPRGLATDATRGMPLLPGIQSPPINAQTNHAPMGPHPDKKHSSWDIYGEPRNPNAPKMSHAHVGINQDYLEVEGATDRRVRTASVAHKKNANKAPSVSTVRKAGTHTIGREQHLVAKDILGDVEAAGPDEHWKVSSTMQGLGDSNNLVEVVPGACRFGPLRVGSVYRMAFFLRNLDVDVTRFNVGVQSEFVSVKHQPGHLAPGMAAKIVVEILAKVPAKIEQLVEVKVKAHVIKVPVTARIFDAEEYDRLDAESLALHERRIGRHREKSDPNSNKPPPVELVVDSAYCRKVLGPSYQPPPPDFADQAMPRQPSHLR